MANTLEERLKALQAAMAKIEKSYGHGSIMRLGEENIEKIDCIPTGSIGLNAALGIGGYPKGRIIEIYGPESSGKTTLALHAIAECQKEGGIAAFIDAEHAFDRFYASKLGVDINNRLQARLMSQALRKLTATISKTKTTCIFINQLREKIGVMFGNPETTTGGNALKFYSSVRIDIRKKEAIKNGDEVIGNTVKVKIVKNKVAPPFRKCEFDIMFGSGISRSGELVDLGTSLEILKKSGSWFSYGDSKLAQGREAVKQVLEDNPELAEEIQTKIQAKLTGKELEAIEG